MPNEPITRGVHHVGLTVPDLDRARGFFVDTLGFRQVGEKPGYPAVFVTDGHTMITLWRARDPQHAVPFDRHGVIGLHHLALRVAPDALDGLHDKLVTADGVEVEFAPELLGAGPARHMMCTIPGGIRVEFIAPAA
jgi:catechol 2,3-dioxygenase-like lactoylglutathione lyase family enzyme